MRPTGSLVVVLVVAGGLLAGGCGPFDPLAVAQAQESERVAASSEPGAVPGAGVVTGKAKPRLEVKNLPCFDCHDYEWWANGPTFPHRKKPHREEGHCNVCHGTLGHETAQISRDLCISCHEAEELAGFAASARAE